MVCATVGMVANTVAGAAVRGGLVGALSEGGSVVAVWRVAVAAGALGATSTAVGAMLVPAGASAHAATRTATKINAPMVLAFLPGI